MQINKSWASICIVILVFILYGNSLNNNYSLDDHLVNSQNELTQHGIKGIPEIFENYSFSEKNLTYAYRPIVLCSFAIEYQLFGQSPKTSHLISILLYALFCALLFYFLQLVFPTYSIWVKFFAVVIFVIHPIHTELVDNIKSRDELLVAVFGISMLLQYLKFCADKKMTHLILMGLYFCLGYFSKPAIYLYVGSIPFLFLILKDNHKKWISVISITLGIALLYIAVRFVKHQLLLGEHQERNYLFFENPLVNANFFERIPTGISIGISYLKMLFYPLNLSYYYGYNQVPISTWGSVIVYLSLVFHSGLVFLMFKIIKKNAFVSFAIFTYLINIIAVSNLFTLIPGLVGERFIFFGSVGFSMILSFMFFMFFEKIKWFSILEKKVPNSKIIFIFLVLIIFCGKQVISRNKVWKDDFSLVSSDVNHAFNSAKAHDMLAYQLLGKVRVESDSPRRNSDVDEAIKNCELAIFIYPNFATSWNNLGTLYVAQQDYQKAEVCFKKVVSFDSTDANPLFNLGNVYQMQLKPELSLQYYKLALSKNSDLFDLIPVYKKFIIQNNKVDEAIEFIRDLEGMHSESYDLKLLLIDFFNSKNDYKSMLIYLKRADALKPSKELKNYIEKISKFIAQ